MPYCFIWSGFVLKGLNISRISNGSIEEYIGHKKSKISSPLLPAEFVNFTFKSTQGKAIEFIDLKSKLSDTCDNNSDVDDELENDSNDCDVLVDEVYSLNILTSKLRYFKYFCFRLLIHKLKTDGRSHGVIANN